jgi:phosphocarrier protein
MKKTKVVVPNKLGLHARASAQFVGVANQFPCDVQVQRDAIVVNGKSMMAIMTLAASQGTAITIITDGKQEKKAIDALQALVNQGFGEKS